MTPEEYRRAVELFAQLQDMAVEERRAALDAACEGNPALRAQTLRLLDADSHAAGGDFLGRPAIEDAARLVSTEEVQSPSPGTVLGNYRLGRRIGAGGMGIVYEAQDQRLHRRVALKILPQPFAAEGSDRIKRFQQEARAASLLSHPNIVSIFDAGADQGFYYIAMEFVEGKTVRELASEGGTGDCRMALDVVAQTAAALSAAHAAGIVHRDIKPENIMVRPDGFVKVLDFSLAKRRERRLPAAETATLSDLHTRPGHLAGTIQYLSPEQVIGKPLDGRSDIFSLGVVAYELATGRRPFDGMTDGAIFDAILHHTPEPPSSVQPQLGKDLDALVLRALEKDRELHIQTANDLASLCKRLLRDSSLGSDAAPRQPRAVMKGRIWQRRKAAIAAAAAALVAAFVAAGGYMAWQRFHRPPLSDKDVIVLSDFANTTGDPVFDGTLKQALTTQLEDSSYLSILSDDRLRRALSFLGKKASERVTPEIARQICEREAIKAVVTGTISPVGSHYLLTLEAVACANGETLARVEEQAQSKEKTLAAVAAAAYRLRGRLGDSLARVKAPAAMLSQQVTTASLEAYKQYALGREAGFAGDQRKALSFDRRAIELDPSFASAYASVAAYYANWGESMLAREYIAKAYPLRDRVSERERLVITGHYFTYGVEDLHQAVDVNQQLASAYPRSSAFAGLGTRYEQLGEFEPALEAYRRALDLDPRNALAYFNVLTVSVKLNRLEDAKAIGREAFRNGLEPPALHNRLLQIAYFQEDMEEVRKQEDWLRPRSAEHFGAQQGAEWNSAHGRFRKAEEWLTVVRSDLPRDHPGAIAQFSSLSAIDDALIGDCRSIRPSVSDALARDRERELIGPAGVALGLCGESAQADALAEEVQSGWPQGTIANAVDVPSIRAAVALHAGKPEAAVAGLQSAAPYERAYPIPSYIRGLAYLRMKSGAAAAAAAEFQKVIDSRVGFIGGPPRNLYCAGRVWAAAYLGLGRAQAMAGNAAEARKAYEKFLDLWKDADPGIPLLAEARKEYAALAREP